jgi:hypothetical protein
LCITSLGSHFWGCSAWLLCVLGPLAVQAQAPEWQTAVAISQATTTYSKVTATAITAEGDVYVGGYFFGPARFRDTTLTSTRLFDVFVAKWSAASQHFTWVQQAGGSGYDYLTALAVNGPNVYVTGTFQDTATFGPVALTSSSDGLDQTFVAKLVDEGSRAHFVWAQQGGGPLGSLARALAVNGPNVYVAGNYSLSATFGSTTLGGNGNGFVAKLVDAGPTASFEWAQGVAVGGGRITQLVAQGSTVYLGGFFFSIGYFSPYVLEASSHDYADGFVAKLTDSGSSCQFTWVQPLTGYRSKVVQGLTVRGSNVYVAGDFSETIHLGSLTLSSPLNEDIFVARLSDAGATSSFVWAQQAGGPGNDYAQGLAGRGDQLYVAGTCARNATFGRTTLSGDVNSASAFVAKLTDAGTTGRFDWAQAWLGADVSAQALAVSTTKVFVGGSFADFCLFGNYYITNRSGNPTGVFASLDDQAVLATAVPTPATTGLILYPNPAHGTTTVRLPVTPQSATATLTLLDALGRMVRTQTVPATSSTASVVVDLADIAPGAYALRVAVGTSVGTTWLLVE